MVLREGEENEREREREKEPEVKCYKEHAWKTVLLLWVRFLVFVPVVMWD